MNAVRPITYLITKGDATPENFPEKRKEIVRTVAAAVAAGISMIQLREKRITARQLFELTAECAALISSDNVKLVVNGRADIAVAGGADGVHLPEDGIPIPYVRGSFPKPFLIGASVHSVQAAKAAKSDGADFALFGPVFDSGEKKAKGIEELTQVRQVLGEFPVLAIGGINETNYGKVVEAGAAGYASIRYLNDHLRRYE
jgi:thiamine-phosphate pyrophosphorylase